MLPKNQRGRQFRLFLGIACITAAVAQVQAGGSTVLVAGGRDGLLTNRGLPIRRIGLANSAGGSSSPTAKRATSPMKTAGPVRMIAHRGGVVDGHHPENSVGAAEEAIRRGYWMLEMDLQESKDGRLVVHHDDFEKSFGVRKWPGQMTWDEIRRLHAAEDGSRPLEFAEYAAICKGKVQLMIDTKEPSHPPRFYESLERTLRENGLLNGAYFIGTEEARASFKGKSRISVSRAELQKKLDAGEETKGLYFLFEHGTTLDEKGLALAARAGVPAVVSINEFHYAGKDHMKAARDDIERLRGQGLTNFQIDSIYDVWLR